MSVFFSGCRMHGKGCLKIHIIFEEYMSNGNCHLNLHANRLSLKRKAGSIP